MPRHKFQRGNKFGGRKAIPEHVKAIARAATPRAIQRQIELMESKDRAFGKPAQTLNTNVARRDLLEYSITELVAIAHEGRTGAQTIEGNAEERQTSSIAAK